MPTIYEEAGKVTVEYDPVSRIAISHWKRYAGPQFRAAVERMLAEVKKRGIAAYISDASQAMDVPSQADFQWTESHVKPALLAAGLKRFITVLPASALAKLGTNRIGLIASNAGVETYQVGSLGEALAAAKRARAA